MWYPPSKITFDAVYTRGCDRTGTFKEANRVRKGLETWGWLAREDDDKKTDKIPSEGSVKAKKKRVFFGQLRSEELVLRIFARNGSACLADHELPHQPRCAREERHTYTKTRSCGRFLCETTRVK